MAGPWYYTILLHFFSPSVRRKLQIPHQLRHMGAFQAVCDSCKNILVSIFNQFAGGSGNAGFLSPCKNCRHFFSVGTNRDDAVKQAREILGYKALRRAVLLRRL